MTTPIGNIENIKNAFVTIQVNNSPSLSSGSFLDIELDFLALIEEKTNNFTGRLWLFDKINDWFNSESKDHLMLLGVPGFGKTSVAAKIIKEWFPDQIASYYFCESDSPHTLKPACFLRNLARMLKANVPHFESFFSQRSQDLINSNFCETAPKEVFQSAILDPLSKISNQSPRLIVIDALEESILSNTDITIAKLIEAKQKMFPFWLRLLVTARNEFDIKRAFAFGFTVEDLDVGSLENKKDVEQFIKFQLNKYRKDFKNKGWLEEDVIQIIAEKSNGNFLYAYLSLRELANSRIKHIQNLPTGLEGLYLRFFNRHFSLSEKNSISEKFDKIKSLLEILVVAHKPLSKDFLSFILSEKVSVISKNLRLISQFLDERGGKYSLFHKSFNDWLLEQSQNADIYTIEPENGNAKIGKSCVNSILENNQFVNYSLNNVIPHLISGGCEDNLYLLLDFEISSNSSFAIKHIQDLFIGLGAHERSVSEVDILPRLEMLKRVVTRLEERFLMTNKDFIKSEHTLQSQIIEELMMAIVKVNFMIADRHEPTLAIKSLIESCYKNRKFIRYVSSDRRRTHLGMAAILFFKLSGKYISLNERKRARRYIRRSLFLRRNLVKTSIDISERLGHRAAILWCLITLGNYVGGGDNNQERIICIELAYKEFKVLKKESEEIGIQVYGSEGIMFSSLASIHKDKKKEYLTKSIEAYKKAFNYSMDDRQLEYTLASAMGYLCDIYLSEDNIIKGQALLSESESYLNSCLEYKPFGEPSYERLNFRLSWSRAMIQFISGNKKIALHCMDKIINEIESLSKRFPHPVIEKDIDRYSREKIKLENF